MRVHELAKELGFENKEFIEKLKKVGVDVKSHLSGLNDEQEKSVRVKIKFKSTSDSDKNSKKEMDVNIISIVLGDSNGTKTATVRAELIEKDLQSKTTTTYIKVFSMTYEYLPQIKQNESSRLNNPLGFLITFYKSDNEILKSEQK